MKLENQVVSPELAQKLKSLGVKQESLFFHFIGAVTDNHDLRMGWDSKGDINFTNSQTYSAFTCSELGEMLPAFVDTKEFRYSLHIDKGGKPWWWVDYRNGETTYNKFDVLFCGEADNEADARAKMLIYLLENKLINTLSQ